MIWNKRGEGHGTELQRSMAVLQAFMTADVFVFVSILTFGIATAPPAYY
jgi:hypothetical protein